MGDGVGIVVIVSGIAIVAFVGWWFLEQFLDN